MLKIRMFRSFGPNLFHEILRFPTALQLQIFRNGGQTKKACLRLKVKLEKAKFQPSDDYCRGFSIFHLRKD